MNRYLSVLTLACLSCQGINAVPKIGDNYSLSSNFNLLMIAPDFLLPADSKVIDNIRFDIAIGPDGKVFYVGTSDSKFRTPESLSVGSTLKDVLTAGGSTPIKEANWAYCVKLPSGWIAAFNSGKDRTSAPLANQEQVSWFFKRK